MGAHSRDEPVTHGPLPAASAARRPSEARRAV